jgi:serine/threonine protein kinase
VFLATPVGQLPGHPAQVAMKIVTRPNVTLEIDEQLILKSLRHPNVLRMYESYTEANCPVLILEYAELGIHSW